MQGVTVFIPIYEAWASRRHMRTILSIIEDWQGRHAHSGSTKLPTSNLTSPTLYEESTNAPSLSSSTKSQMYTLASLEKALAFNPKPLLRYAATRDFTAENIVFLMQVRRWRAAYPSTPQMNQIVTEEARTHLFALAVDIYISSVSEKTAEYPINIEGPIRSALDSVFARAVPEGKFSWNLHPNAFNQTLQRITYDRQTSSDSEASWEKSAAIPLHTIMPPSPGDKESLFKPHPGVAPLGKARARIPAEFNESIFDAAEKSIKYLVLTNTWRKFVSSGEQDLGGTV
jgi:hypothetical protein